MYLTEQPKLPIKCRAVYLYLPQNTGLAINNINFQKNMVVVYLTFQGEWHLLSAILNKQPPKILYRIHIGCCKCLGIKQYAEEQYMWAENQ
jgi:hypothetical protein